MNSRVLKRLQTDEEMLAYLRRCAGDPLDSEWHGQRATDIAAAIGWHKQLTVATLKRLVSLGQVRTRQVVRIKSRYRRKIEIQYQAVHPLAEFPAWLLFTPRHPDHRAR